jgi:hypothetical protein
MTAGAGTCRHFLFFLRKMREECGTQQFSRDRRNRAPLDGQRGLSLHEHW